MNPEELNKKKFASAVDFFAHGDYRGNRGQTERTVYMAVQCGIPRGLFTAPRDEDWANIIRRWKLAGRGMCHCLPPKRSAKICGWL